MLIALSDLTDVPGETNSQAEGISGFQVTGLCPYFQHRNFVHWQCCRKVRLMLQRSQMLMQAVWCSMLS